MVDLSEVLKGTPEQPTYIQVTEYGTMSVKSKTVTLEEAKHCLDEYFSHKHGLNDTITFRISECPKI